MSKKVVKYYTLVGYDERGDEVERVPHLTAREADLQRQKYYRVWIMESEVVSPKEMCDLHDNNVAIATVVTSDGKTYDVCKYHAAGVYITFRGIPVEGRIKLDDKVVAPSWLCVKFCPSYAPNKCWAFATVNVPKKVLKAKEKGYKGMGILCIQDPWWRESIQK